MQLTTSQIEKIQANNLKLIDSFEKLHLEGLHLDTEYCYLFKAPDEQLWQITSKRSAFYVLHGEEHWIDEKRIATANNVSRLKQQQANIIKTENTSKINAFLVGIYGDSLPAQKKIATVKKYLNDVILLAYVNGKRGVQGISAEKSFFKTLAYTEFYLSVMDEVELENLTTNK
jgi:hypothetical protein